MDVETDIAELKQRLLTLGEHAAQMEAYLGVLGSRVAKAEGELAAFRLELANYLPTRIGDTMG